jgi:hypothetical protein
MCDHLTCFSSQRPPSGPSGLATLCVRRQFFCPCLSWLRGTRRVGCPAVSIGRGAARDQHACCKPVRVCRSQHTWRAPRGARALRGRNGRAGGGSEPGAQACGRRGVCGARQCALQPGRQNSNVQGWHKLGLVAWRALARTPDAAPLQTCIRCTQFHAAIVAGTGSPSGTPDLSVSQGGRRCRRRTSAGAPARSLRSRRWWAWSTITACSMCARDPEG